MDAELQSRLDRIEALALLSAKNVFSVKDVALLTGKTEKTIRNRLGEIPHFRGPLGVAFRRDELEKWMCQVSITPVSSLLQF